MKTINIPITQTTLDRIGSRTTGLNKTVEIAINEIIDKVEELEGKEKEQPIPTVTPKKKNKSPVRMAELSRLGLLSEGQKMTFCERNGTSILDGHGNEIQAYVHGNELSMAGKYYKVSVLAKKIAKQCGKRADNYAQGTPHWKDQSDNSLWDLGNK